MTYEKFSTPSRLHSFADKKRIPMCKHQLLIYKMMTL